MRGAIILAGGPSRRLGRPKAFVELGGTPLIERVLESARPVVDEVLIVARGKIAGKLESRFGGSVRLIRDRARVQTPLAGLVAGAAASQSPVVAALPCDLPFLRPPLLRRLFVLVSGHDAAIPRWPNGMIEPLVAVYDRQALHTAAREALLHGGRSNQDMIDRLHDVRHVDVERLRRYDPRLRSFVNVNTPADLARARRLVTRRAGRPRTR